MLSITHVTGTGVPVLLDDIDTDRIIPARFLRCVTFEGLGEHAFEDDRRQNPAHAFNDPRFRGASVLIAGRNFGCGSSREHAPQSLMRWGIKAIVAESFAEIFFGNCASLGIPAVCVPRSDLEQFAAAVEHDPQQMLTVDLQLREVRCGEHVAHSTMPADIREALVTGQWDFLGQLLDARDQIARTAASLPYICRFAS